MNFYVMTLFPEMIEEIAGTSILGRAMENGHLTLQAVNIRDYTKNKHKKVDDYPYGGGAGMLIQAQPVYDCFQVIKRQMPEKSIRVIYLTPQGKTFQQKMAQEFAKEEDLVFLCGHYEGIDERVLEEIVTDYVSIGDYVLTGGELPAMVMMDAIARLVPGVLHNETSADFETFHNDLLEYPQYSRPEEWMGKKVPEVLLCGNHKKIEAWRLEESKRRTKENRPDLYEKFDDKQRVIEKLLKKNKLLYMDIAENLRRGRGELVWSDEDGVIVHDKAAGVFMAAGWQQEEKIAKLLLQNIREKEQLVIHQESVLRALEKEMPIKKITPVRQAVYTQRSITSASKDVEIRVLGIEHIEEVLAHYALLSDREYIAERLNEGNIVGAYIGGVLAGFAGTHSEGSIGMLEVFEEYRRKGIGRALEAYMVNKHLSLGYTPYGQVITDNEVSYALQEKMGLRISKEIFYWVTPKETTVKEQTAKE